MGELLVQNDFRISTWLCLGACLHAIAIHWIPINVALVAVVLFLAYHIWPFLRTRLRPHQPSYNIFKGRWSARVSADKNDASGVVMFVLGARTLHPAGRFANGCRESADVFDEMWVDAKANSEKYGFLGATEQFFQQAPDGNLTMLWLSYWEDLDRLRLFAMGDAHRLGWNNYLAKKYHNLGIMHETYSAPPGSWESIYYNFHRFGLGNIRNHPVACSEKFPHGKEDSKSEHSLPLFQAKGVEMRSMFSRMGREES